MMMPTAAPAALSTGLRILSAIELHLGIPSG